VTTTAPGFIVQLLDMEHNVIDSLRNEQRYQFNEVAPGNYRLRLLVLQDKEGEWRFGNIHERKEPDPVVFYPADVAVIANWEIGGIDFYFWEQYWDRHKRWSKPTGQEECQVCHLDFYGMGYFFRWILFMPGYYNQDVQTSTLWLFQHTLLI